MNLNEHKQSIKCTERRLTLVENSTGYRSHYACLRYAPILTLPDVGWFGLLTFPLKRKPIKKISVSLRNKINNVSVTFSFGSKILLCFVFRSVPTDCLVVSRYDTDHRSWPWDFQHAAGVFQSRRSCQGATLVLHIVVLCHFRRVVMAALFFFFSSCDIKNAISLLACCDAYTRISKIKFSTLPDNDFYEVKIFLQLAFKLTWKKSREINTQQPSCA